MVASARVASKSSNACVHEASKHFGVVSSVLRVKTRHFHSWLHEFYIKRASSSLTNSTTTTWCNPHVTTIQLASSIPDNDTSYDVVSHEELPSYTVSVEIKIATHILQCRRYISIRLAIELVPINTDAQQVPWKRNIVQGFKEQ